MSRVPDVKPCRAPARMPSRGGKLRGGVAMAGLALTLVGCATHEWAPGPGMSGANFESGKARCSLMARHGGSNFEAYGSVNFVASAAIGHAVGEAIRTQQDFNDCMLATGWRIADGQAKGLSQKATAIRNILGQAAAEIGAAREKPAYQAIRQHFIAPNARSYSMEQLADLNVPAPTEVDLLAAYYDEVRLYREEAIQELSGPAPKIADMMSELQSESDAIVLQAVKRQITWGDLAVGQQKILDTLQQKLRSTPM